MPALYHWLAKFKGVLVSKVSLSHVDSQLVCWFIGWLVDRSADWLAGYLSITGLPTASHCHGRLPSCIFLTH